MSTVAFISESLGEHMSESAVHATVSAFIEAIHRGDLDGAVGHYAPDAQFVVQPGTTLTGQAAIREALAQMLAIRPRLTTHSYRVLATGGNALYQSQWSLTGTAPDGSAVTQSGRSADVLVRTDDGRWLIQIDNPWGSAILDS